jgi:chorismate synthase
MSFKHFLLVEDNDALLKKYNITNGEPIVFRVAFKPVATIGREQATVDFDGNPVTLAAKGRHDPCVVPRAVPVVEAMAALVLADCYLRQLQRR